MPSVQAFGYPILVNDLAVPSLLAWQADVLKASGWDYLGNTKGSWRSIEKLGSQDFIYDYAYLSWHKTGRALDLDVEFLAPDGVDQQLVVQRRPGPKHLLAHLSPDGQAGRHAGRAAERQPLAILVARRKSRGSQRPMLPVADGHGSRMATTSMLQRLPNATAGSGSPHTLIEGDYDWHVHSNGTEYWHYERTDGLTWWDAMRQIYPLEKLDQYFSWKVALSKKQSQDMARSKGIPTPQP